MSSQSQRDELLVEVVLEYEKALDAGQAPDPRELVARHPELASELGDYLACQSALPPALRKPPPPTFPAQPRNYEILGELGRGGMGIVYKARQLNPPRLVALKTICDRSEGDDETRQRFATEVANVARLDHPHIVPLYELGEEQGQPFFSMKLIDGPSLATALRQRGKPLAAKEAARLLVLVARAVHHAHQRGVLHRDLKPANILLQRTEPKTGETLKDGVFLESEFEPYVSDFGLARPVEGDGRLTRTDGIIGTPSYMSPEQASAQKDLTIAVDVYGLGAILYECLTLQPPFSASNVLDVLVKIRTEEPVPPRKLNPSLDRDLEAICLKCLEKEPARRYSSAEQLALDLENWLNNKPLLARPSGQWERLRKWSRRRPGVASLLAALLLITPLGVAGITWQAIEKGRALARTEVQVYYNLIKLAQRDIDARQLDAAEETLNLCDEKLRNFEWRYLKRLCKLERLELKGRNGTIMTAAYSPDGKLLATASQDGMLSVWETSTGKQVHSGLLGSRLIRGLCFTGDGRYLLSTSQDRGLVLWDYQKGQKPMPIDPDSDGSFACGGGLVASIREKNETVQVWELATLQKGARLNPLFTIRQDRRPLSVALSRDGTKLAVGGFNRLVMVWRIKGSALEPCEGFHYDEKLGRRHIRALAFSADGKLLATGSDQTAIWDVSTGLLVRSFNGAAELTCSSISFSAPRPGILGSKPGSLLAATFLDNQVRIWDTEKSRVLMPPQRQARPTRAVHFSPVDEDTLAMLRENTVSIVKVSPGDTKSSVVLQQPPGRRLFQAITFSPDGSWLAARARDLTTRTEGNHLLLWPVETLSSAVATKLDAPRESGRANLAFSADNQMLVAGASTQALAVWDPSGVPRNHEAMPIKAARLVAFSKHRFLATCGGNIDRVKLWDLNKDREVPIEPFASEIYALAFSPEGSQLAISGTSTTARVYEATTGRLQYELQGLRPTTTCLAFSQDGKLLVTGGTDQSLRLWNARDGRVLGVLKGHASQVDSVAVSPDGARIASCSLDGSVKLWDVAGQQEVLTLAGHDGPATGVAFSPDGLRLASCGDDGCVRIWDATPTGDDS
jgi:WD40 repeat protein/serine/threonine protein kinase